MASTVHARALHRAAEMLGGKNRLRELLRVSMSQLDLWMAGGEKPPMDVFLKAVDIISASDPHSAAPVSDQVLRARRLRRESAKIIRRALLARRLLVPVALKPASAQAFLEAEFEPDDGGAMIEAALDAAIGATGADMGNVQIVSPQGLRIVASRGFEQPFLDFFAVVDHRCAASCGVALKAARRIVVPDVASDPIFAGTPSEEVMAKAGIRSVQSTPLIGASGELHGMLSTHWASPRALSPKDEEALDRTAQRAAFWLDGGAVAP